LYEVHRKEQKAGTENGQEDNCTAHTNRSEHLVLKDGGEDDLLSTVQGTQVKQKAAPEICYGAEQFVQCTLTT
jgi:hypothetical protein